MGRPINKKYFGPDTETDSTKAVATYDTDESGDISAITIISGGAGYEGNFSVVVEDGEESATIDFTVVDGEVTAGEVDAQSGAFTVDESDVSIDMPAPAGIGQNFQILPTSVWIPGEEQAEGGYIVKQRSNRRFLVHGNTSGTEGICTLVDRTPAAEGEMQIVVIPSDGQGGTLDSENARTISSKKVRTFDGNWYAWSDLGNPAAAGPEGAADLGIDEQE